MTTKISGTEGIQFPDASTQGSAADAGPAFSAYQSSTPQSLTSVVPSKVTFDAEEFDTSNAFANSRFTPQVAGYYQIDWSIRANSSSSGLTELRSTLQKNGVEVRSSSLEISPASNRALTVGSTLVYLNGSTDYLEVFVVAIGTGTLTITNALSTTNIQGFLARRATP